MEPKRINYRAVARPTNDSELACVELIAAISRHCDCGTISAAFDLVCPFCGYTWDFDNKGTPDCCDEANTQWEKEQAEIDGKEAE